MLILIGLMILHKTVKQTGLIKVLEYVLLPVVWLMGLSKNAAFLWVVANILGLAYGGGVLIQQREEGSISERHLTELNISMAICHSLLEDSLLFLAIGASGLWIVAPRMLFAALIVWSYRGIMRGWQGTGPFFGENACSAEKRLAENMGLSPSRGAPPPDRG